jgi:hypothetical protein
MGVVAGRRVLFGSAVGCCFVGVAIVLRLLLLGWIGLLVGCCWGCDVAVVGIGLLLGLQVGVCRASG